MLQFFDFLKYGLILFLQLRYFKLVADQMLSPIRGSLTHDDERAVAEVSIGRIGSGGPAAERKSLLLLLFLAFIGLLLMRHFSRVRILLVIFG